MIEPGEDKATIGLIAKFQVERLTPSTRGIDHSHCRYFVLDPRHDLIARDALRSYAVWALADGQTRLAADLSNWLDELEVSDKVQSLGETLRRAQGREVEGP